MISLSKVGMGQGFISFTGNQIYTYDGNPQFTRTSLIIDYGTSNDPSPITTFSYSGNASDGSTYGPISIRPTNAGNYSVIATVTFNDISGSFNSLPVNFVINKATPTLSITNSPLSYDGNVKNAIINRSVSGTLLNIQYNGSSTAPVNAGTYSVTADFTPTDAINYNNLTGASAGNLIINKATPTLSIQNSPVTYSSNPIVAIVSSNISGNIIQTYYNGSSTVPINAGTYSVTADFTPTDATNYNNLTLASVGNFIINKATPTLSITNSPITYDGNVKNATINSSVVGALLNIQYSGSSTAPVNAGTYSVTADFTPTDATNYNNLTGASAGNFIISKATPTLSITNSPIIYDGNVKNATINSSVVGALLNIQYNGSSTAPVNAGTYSVTADFTPTDATNYNNLTRASAGNFIINKVTPTLSITNSPITYDGNIKNATINSSVVGALSNIKYNGISTVPTNAGTYTVVADFIPTDVTNYNSLIGSSAGNFIINKATPTLTISNSPVTYNTLVQSAIINGSVVGTLSNIQYNGSSTGPTNAGTYAVTADFTPTDATNFNSIIGSGVGNFIINKVTPTINVSNSPVTYDGNLKNSTINGSVAGTPTNIQYNGSSTVPINAGTYAVTADFTPTDVTNYNILTGASAGNFVINILQVNVIANPNSKIYGSNDPVLTYTNSSIAPGDTFSGNLTRSIGEDVNTYNIQKGTLTLSNNYNINFTSASFNITPAHLTIAGISGANKVYDRNTTASVTGTPIYIGLVAGENLNVVGTPTYSFANKKAGTAKPITVSGFTAPNGNYTLSAQPTGITADITPKLLTVTGTVPVRVYDATTNTPGLTLDNNRISGDIVNVSRTSAAFENPNAGVNKNILLSGVNIISGDDGENYFLANPNITIQGTITPLPININSNDAIKTETDPDPVFSFTNSPSLIAPDTFTGSLSRNFLGVNSPGDYALNIGTLSAGNNYILNLNAAKLTIKPLVTNYIFEVPNAFTPNLDGTNDLLNIIKNYRVTGLNYFRIYNRTGQLVFETNNLAQGWNGRRMGDMSGNVLESDLYIWVAEFTRMNDSGGGVSIERKTGSVLLLK
jgi:gliding motility-associated-like protein